MPDYTKRGPLARVGPPILLDGVAVSDGFHYENSAEGGSEGVTVTTGNSGGASGQAFDTVNITGAATVLYSGNTVTPIDTRVIQFNQPGANGPFVQWTSQGNQNRLWTRFYLWIEQFPTGANWRTLLIRDVNTNTLCYIEITPGALWLIGENAGPIQTNTVPLATGQWYRFEAFYGSSTNDPKITARLYRDPNAGIDAYTEQMTGGTATGVPAFQYRLGSALANGPPFRFDMDNIGLTNQGWLGPLGTAPYRKVDVLGLGHKVRIGRLIGPPVLGQQRLAGGGAGPPLTTITVDTPGAVTYTGQAVQLTTTLQPTAGAITYTGATDLTVSSGTVVTVDTPGAITYTGQAVQLTTNVQPTAGAVTWTGQTIQLTTQANIVAGAVTWSGQTVSLVTIINSNAGAITWSGQTIQLQTIVLPSAGNVTYSGQTVTITGGGAPTKIKAIFSKRRPGHWRRPFGQSRQYYR